MFRNKSVSRQLFQFAVSGAALSACLCIAAETHTVKAGDTLYRVATANGMSVDEVRRLNNLGKQSGLSVGQTLTVSSKPSGESVDKTADSLSLATVQPASSTIKTPKAAKKAVIKETLSPKAGSPKKLKRSGKVVTNTALPTKKALSNNETVGSSANAHFRGPVQLASASALVVDAETGKMLVSKNTGETKPIASITKLMTAMVALDAGLSMQETLKISDADVDHLKQTSSRLPLGTRLTRYEMLRLALMSSENRASSSHGHVTIRVVRSAFIPGHEQEIG